MAGKKTQAGMALYVVVAALSLLGLVAAGTVTISVQRASAAAQKWNEAQNRGVMGLALNSLAPMFIQGGAVYEALRQAASQGLNATASQYLNPGQTQATAQSLLGTSTTNACPTGSADNGRYAWKAYIFLSPTATVCGKTPNAFGTNLETARRQSGKDKTGDNNPLQVYAFPVLVGLELTSNGLASTTTLQGTYYAWVGPYHPGWWTLAGYGSTQPSLGNRNLEVRGGIYTALSPALTPPYQVDGALASSRCTSVSGGTSCTGAKQGTVSMGGQTLNPGLLRPLPWLPCGQGGCAVFTQGVDWGVNFQPFPALTAPAIGNLSLGSPSSITLSAGIQNNTPYLEIRAASTTSTSTYYVWLSTRTNNAYYCKAPCTVGYFGTYFSRYVTLSQAVTVNASTLSEAPTLVQSLNLTFAGPEFTLAGNILPASGGCVTDTEGKTTCPGEVLPVTFYATNRITVNADQVHANLIAPTLNFTKAATVFGAAHYQTLNAPSALRVYSNPRLTEAPPRGASASSATVGALTFAGLVPGR